MAKIVFISILALLVGGCGMSDLQKLLNPFYADTPDSSHPVNWGNNVNESAQNRERFLQRPIVQEFKAAGLSVDCDPEYCAQITDSTLETLKSFKEQFLSAHSRVKKIVFMNKYYPYYDYDEQIARMPIAVIDSAVAEFFEVLEEIQNFEKQVGFRVDFPNSWCRKASIGPLLEILQNNLDDLKLEARRFDLLAVSSKHSVFSTSDRVLVLKSDDLKSSFSELWSFMKMLFKAQDLFGNVVFEIQKDDMLAISNLKAMFEKQDVFQPLFSKMQGRRIQFKEYIAENTYYDIRGSAAPLFDLVMGSRFDVEYLENVLRDQVKVREVEDFVGTKLRESSWDGNSIELESRAECWDKIDKIKSQVRQVAHRVDAWYLNSSTHFGPFKSSYYNGDLWIYCGQPIEEIETLLKSIK